MQGNTAKLIFATTIEGGFFQGRSSLTSTAVPQSSKNVTATALRVASRETTV